eukprot:CAMPEP_0202863852 /NCGR_PEP_ID=MMETSP1391-20130828/4321_1 /ASSEMBLY_ACC=CAM_ASM_000867 /TAXON_ID=1034604 /ORGANISM="Chlamydomonas leiostraca, Strain SAG 11-49" /LENGTH=146 /DNA_ID=CAMNT_0049543527 /DNA_START=849 /DNA_END=1287 /DNA_ORIENTATION=+
MPSLLVFRAACGEGALLGGLPTTGLPPLLLLAAAGACSRKGLAAPLLTLADTPLLLLLAGLQAPPTLTLMLAPAVGETGPEGVSAPAPAPGTVLVAGGDALLAPAATMASAKAAKDAFSTAGDALRPLLPALLTLTLVAGIAAVMV